MDKRNREKASLLYNEIDRNELLSGFCAKEDRSLMNVSFKLNDESLTQAFEAHLEKHGIVGLNGHRSKGGYRASMYNMMPVSHFKMSKGECVIIKHFYQVVKFIFVLHPSPPFGNSVSVILPYSS